MPISLPWCDTQNVLFHSSGNINDHFSLAILTLCRLKPCVGFGYISLSSPLHELGKSLVTWFICFTCDYLSNNCCHWLYEVSLCGNVGGGRYDYDDSYDDSILPITFMSLGELNESVFLLALLNLLFHRKPCVAAFMVKFKLLLQQLS